MIELNMEYEIAEMLESIAATPKQVRQATRRALGRTAKHMDSVMARATAKLANVPLKAIRGRFYHHLSKSRDAASIWIGTNDIRLSALGEYRQTPTGVRVGRLFYRGAFVLRADVGRGEGIFIRYNSKHYSPVLYATPGGKSGRLRPGAAYIIARARPLPVMEESVDRAFTNNEASFEQFFIRAFRGELARAMEGKR